MMNCAECRDNLVACLEGLLDPEHARECQAHLETCAACRAEYAATARLQEQLTASGRLAADVSLVAPVMRRVRRESSSHERTSIMSRLLQHRWGFGLSAAAGAAAVILLFALSAPRVQARAVEVMTKGARAVAKLTSIHLRGQVRTAPADNFGFIKPEAEFYPIEMWKQYEPELKWRAEKPGRVALMDGQTTLLYIKPLNQALKVPQPARSAFDTDWLHKIANLSQAITDEIENATAKGWKLNLTTETAPDGRKKAVVTVEAKSRLPDNDYLKNKFFDDSDTRRVYRFDDESERLEAVQVYLVRNAGEVLIFELTQIEYNPALDPAVFQLQLPDDVHWYKEMEKLPDNEKYAAMTAEQAARAFFEACGRQDWTEVAKFWTGNLNEGMRQYLGGLEIVSLGQAFTSKAYDPSGRFVPYEIKLKQGGTIKKHNLALKRDRRTGRWFVDGGI